MTLDKKLLSVAGFSHRLGMVPTLWRVGRQDGAAAASSVASLGIFPTLAQALLPQQRK